MYNVMILKNEKTKTAYVRTNKKSMSLNELEYLKTKYLSTQKRHENNTLTSFITDNYNELTQEVIAVDTDVQEEAEAVKAAEMTKLVASSYTLANVNFSMSGGFHESSSVKRMFKRYKKMYQVLTDERTADSVFPELYNKYDINELVAKYSRETVLQARKTLTVNEFELRFFNVA